MDPDILLLDLQLLLSLLLFLLFWILARGLTARPFFRWWMWAWASLAVLIAIFRLATVPAMPAFWGRWIYPVLAPQAGYFQVVFFLGGAVALRKGSPPSRRWVTLATTSALLMALLATAVSYTAPEVGLAARTLPRNAGLALALPYCAVAVAGQRPPGGGISFFVAPIAFVMWGVNQFLYAVGAGVEIVEGTLGPGLPLTLDVSFMFSPYATATDMVWEAAIGIGIISILVNEHQEAQARIQRSEARFRTAFDYTPAGMGLVAPDGSIVEINRALAGMLDLQASDLRGRDLAEIVEAADRPRFRELLEMAGDGRSDTREIRFLGGKGVHVKGVVRAKSVLDDRQAPSRIVVHVQDVTEQRALERDLVRTSASEAVAQLAGGIAHHFNNMIQAITGHAELLLEASEPNRDDLEEIVQAGNRGSELTRHLLACTAESNPRPEALHLRDFLREVFGYLRRLVPDNITLTTCLDPTPTVWFDPAQLRHVLAELVENAAEAVEGDSGDITIEVDRIDVSELAGDLFFRPRRPEGGAFVRLRVRDTGHGMGPDVTERVFEPFFSTRMTGRGLGMASVLGIVESHDGAVALDSRPGGGTEVTVLIRPPA